MGSEYGLRQEILELAVEVARAGGVAHGSGGGLAVRNPLLAAVQGVATSCARLYEGGGAPAPSLFHVCGPPSEDPGGTLPACEAPADAVHTTDLSHPHRASAWARLCAVSRPGAHMGRRQLSASSSPHGAPLAR